jgi:hypothetical protein
MKHDALAHDDESRPNYTPGPKTTDFGACNSRQPQSLRA